MQQSPAFSPRSARIGTAGLIVLTLTLAAVAASAIAQPGASKRVVKKVDSPALEKTVLATTKGRTLYSLSVEKHGKFICTGSCLSAWHPLLVPAGVKPTGPVKLGTIVRPEGGTQVTYKGRPLYRFAGDAKAGDTNGEGIKDVGTWHAATTSGLRTEPAPQPAPQPTPDYPYGY